MPNPQKNNAEQEFKNYFHDAMSEKIIGHYDRAIQLFEHCLVLDQGSSAVHFALSDLYEIQGNRDKAIESAKKAYELDELNKWYALRLADLYFEIGDYKQSAAYFDAAIDVNEENTELKFRYAEALIYSNQYREAIGVMNEIELETGKIPQLSLTKHDLYMELGEPEKAEAELQSLINDNPRNTENRLVVAEYFITTNQPEKARKMAEEILLLDPDNGAAHVVLADVALRNADINAAFAHLKIAFSSEDVETDRKLDLLRGLIPYAFEKGNPDSKTIEAGIAELFGIIYDPALKNISLHSYYASFLQQQGKNQEAMEQFRIVSELNPGDFNAWKNLLNSAYDLNAFTDLYENGQRAVELFPAQPIFYLLTGIGAYELGDYDAAEEYFFLGKDLVVGDTELQAEFYYHLGKMSGQKKDYTQAYTYLDESKKLEPSLAKAYGAKAGFLVEEGKTEEAKKEIEKGLSFDPYNAALWYNRGLIQLKEKDYTAALQSIEKATLNDPNNGTILETYGDVLFLTGSKEDAVEIWIEAEKKGNTSSLLKRKIADKTYYEN